MNQRRMQVFFHGWFIKNLIHHFLLARIKKEIEKIFFVRVWIEFLIDPGHVFRKNVEETNKNQKLILLKCIIKS